MAANGASAAHNPSSNLKLGSGVAPVAKMLAAGVNVCLGSDGCSSNNNTDMFTELHLASLVAKGFNRDPQALPAAQALKLANAAGAKAQGREDTGSLEVGKRADIVLVGVDAPHMHPTYTATVAIVQSARAADVRLTMVDGEVLYKDGEYTTLDVEEAIFEMEKLVDKTYR
jgi:5-methylthioadenosine/S-adenosylhomocysteine deaminase